MTDKIKVWRENLRQWEKNNPKVMPLRIQEMRENFVKQFPAEKLSQMTIDQYVWGRPNTFCQELDYGTKELGGISGTPPNLRFGVYWKDADKDYSYQTKKFSSAEDAFIKIRQGIVTLIRDVEKNNYTGLDSPRSPLHQKRLLRGKILYIYFPNRFLPIFSVQHLKHFLTALGQQPVDGDLVALNQQLWKAVRSIGVFEGFDTSQARNFLYHTFPVPKSKGESGEDNVIARNVPIPESVNKILDMTTHTKNILLYGPPGTGKTWTVSRFAEHFLGPQLQKPLPDEQQRIKIIADLTWYEAVALAMAMSPKTEHFTVPELASTDIMRDYATLKTAKQVKNIIWEQLQTHTSPESKTVGSTRRSESFIFDKSSDSKWSLTSAGQEFVELHLGETINQLKHPQEVPLTIKDFYEFVTFHQSFSYEDFIEGIRPIVNEENDGQLRYEVKPGIFKRICARAEAARQAQPDNPPNYLLVIDEINRANIAKVLGELITLIEDDKRLGAANELRVTLPYSGEKSGERFGVPSNLIILGTMNTADRSIALLDLALRRRFTFVEMLPQPELLSKDVAGVDLQKLLTELNKKITALLDKDHQIGHSYLMNLTDADGLRFAWYNRLVPLLQEYFYHDGERLQAVLGKAFVQEIKLDDATRKALGDAYDDAPKFEVNTKLDDAAFLTALQELAAQTQTGGNP